jgi:hypothetical protein
VSWVNAGLEGWRDVSDAHIRMFCSRPADDQRALVPNSRALFERMVML